LSLPRNLQKFTVLHFPDFVRCIQNPLFLVRYNEDLLNTVPANSIVFCRAILETKTYNEIINILTYYHNIMLIVWYVKVRKLTAYRCRKHNSQEDRETEEEQYTSIPVYQFTSIPAYQFTSIPVYQHTSIQVYQFTSIPVYQYTSIPVYQFTSLPVYQYTSLPVYQHTSIPVYIYKEKRVWSWKQEVETSPFSQFISSGNICSISLVEYTYVLHSFVAILLTFIATVSACLGYEFIAAKWINLDITIHIGKLYLYVII
jgi:hypothetical protein